MIKSTGWPVCPGASGGASNEKMIGKISRSFFNAISLLSGSDHMPRCMASLARRSISFNPKESRTQDKL